MIKVNELTGSVQRILLKHGGMVFVGSTPTAST